MNFLTPGEGGMSFEEKGGMSSPKTTVLKESFSALKKEGKDGLAFPIKCKGGGEKQTCEKIQDRASQRKQKKRLLHI